MKAPDSATLLIPDAPGNNRLDTLENIIGTGRIGVLFLIPGVDETLRVNGKARLADDPEMLRMFSSEKRTPRLVIEVKIEDVYLHCAKALMRSKLWSAESQVERTVLPSMGQMLNEQIGVQAPAETQEQMVERYKEELYNPLGPRLREGHGAGTGYFAAVTMISTRQAGSASFASTQARTGRFFGSTHAVQTSFSDARLRMSVTQMVAASSFDLLVPAFANSRSISASTSAV